MNLCVCVCESEYKHMYVWEKEEEGLWGHTDMQYCAIYSTV